MHVTQWEGPCLDLNLDCGVGWVGVLGGVGGGQEGGGGHGAGSGVGADIGTVRTECMVSSPSIFSHCAHHDTSAIEKQAIKVKNKANEICDGFCILRTFHVCHFLLQKG